MSSTRTLGLWQSRVFFSGVALLSFIAAASADPKPLSKEEQAKVDKAIDKAIAYLKRTQKEDGNWSGPRSPSRGMDGESLLAAYALLEAGVATDDPVIRKAAAYFRANPPKPDTHRGTYRVSLGVLFLDRLADPQDEKLLRCLILCLIAGQYPSGGWAYVCPQVKESDEEALFKLLGEMNERVEAGNKLTMEWIASLHVPPNFKHLACFQDPKKLAGRDPPLPEPPGDPKKLARYSATYPAGTITDNSNTQFAMLALWAARRHKFPVRPTLDLLVLRFERMQAADGGWAYSYKGRDFGNGLSSRGARSMTCVGLLALAISRGLIATPRLESSHTESLPFRRNSSAGRHRSPNEKSSHEFEDIRILMGLAELYRHVGSPTGQMVERVPLQDYYFLWSLERVGMLYDLPTLADKEWYRWGAEMLVTNQKPSGEWNGFGKGDMVNLNQTHMGSGSSPYTWGPTVDTAFALLFLKHSHPMKELTPKLPFTAKELNKGIARLLAKQETLEKKITTPSRSKDPDR